MFFENKQNSTIRVTESYQYFHLYYACKNCCETEKIISICIRIEDKNETEVVIAIKLGENPPFRPHVPRKLLNWFDKDEIELFKNGRRAENQGLGIGAFAYYRQLVEQQKDKLIDKIIEIAKLQPSYKEFVKNIRSS